MSTGLLLLWPLLSSSRALPPAFRAAVAVAVAVAVVVSLKEYDCCGGQSPSITTRPKQGGGDRYRPQMRKGRKETGVNNKNRTRTATRRKSLTNEMRAAGGWGGCNSCSTPAAAILFVCVRVCCQREIQFVCLFVCLFVCW